MGKKYFKSPGFFPHINTMHKINILHRIHAPIYWGITFGKQTVWKRGLRTGCSVRSWVTETYVVKCGVSNVSGSASHVVRPASTGRRRHRQNLISKQVWLVFSKCFSYRHGTFVFVQPSCVTKYLIFAIIASYKTNLSLQATKKWAVDLADGLWFTNPWPYLLRLCSRATVGRYTAKSNQGTNRKKVGDKFRVANLFPVRFGKCKLMRILAKVEFLCFTDTVLSASK